MRPKKFHFDPWIKCLYSDTSTECWSIFWVRNSNNCFYWITGWIFSNKFWNETFKLLKGDSIEKSIVFLHATRVWLLLEIQKKSSTKILKSTFKSDLKRKHKPIFSIMVSVGSCQILLVFTKGRNFGFGPCVRTLAQWFNEKLVDRFAKFRPSKLFFSVDQLWFLFSGSQSRFFHKLWGCDWGL